MDEALEYIIAKLNMYSLVPVAGGVAEALIARIQWIRGKYASAVFHGVLTGVAFIPLGAAFKATALGRAFLARLVRVGSAATRVAGLAGRSLTVLKAELRAVKGSLTAGSLTHRAFDLVFCTALRLACFTAGTPLQAEHGPKRIEDVQPGDRVWSRDEFDAAGEVSLKVVEEVFARHAQVLQVRVGDVTIGTTAEHPFYVVGKGWVNANALVPGDRLVGRDNAESVVREVVDTGEWAPVYNM